MKKKFLFVALSALALTACVNDETIEVNPGDAVAFRATSGNATKSQITTTLNISDFKVWGYHQSAAEPSVTTPFMEDQLVQRISGVWTYSPTRFWPESGTIDFYSVSPYKTPGISIMKTEQIIKDYTVNTNISLQKDLLYAVNMGCSKAANGQTGVEVNFRHALSQIVFQAKNTNSNIKVDIEGVKVVNVVSKGTFTYPKKTTSPNLVGTDKDTEYDDTWGDWYEAGVTERTGITPSSEEVALTTVGGGELLLLPQTLSEWVPSTGESGTGSRFLINCKIWNVSGDDEVLLWPGKNEYSEVAIPIPADTKWKQGKKYVYTFIFGEGAGYTPDGKPTPLIPVRFDVTVDDFQQGDNTDMDMEIKEAIDMSEDEKTYGGGNCYVVPKATEKSIRFSFDATKEGRTDDPVGTVVKTGKPASGAKLVAEDTEGLIADITYENGDIIVTPEVNKTGNAIVAVTDEDGTILWSWHLWVVADNSFMTNPPASGSLMDRDLGSSGVITDNEMPENTGLYYQWGRHNPQFLFGENAIKGKKSMEEAIQQPHIFITGVAEGDLRVLWNSDPSWAGNTWSESTIDKYDPTPAGWTIPEDYAFYNTTEGGYFTSKYYNYTYNEEKGYVKLESKDGGEETVTLPISYYYNEITGILETTAAWKTRGSWLLSYSNNMINSVYTYFSKNGGETITNYQMWAQAHHIRPIKE